MKKKDIKKVNIIEKLIDGKKIRDVSELNDFLANITKRVIETLAQGEMTDFLKYKKHDYYGKKNSDQKNNSRNGFSKKKVKISSGEIDINLPRDRKSIFDPKLIEKNKNDFTNINDKIIAMYALGLTTNDIKNNIKEIYGFNISKQTVSNITDTIMEDAKEWQNRTLSSFYPIIFIDAIFLKAKIDSKIKEIAIYFVIGYDQNGMKDCLGLWLAETESAKFWLSIFNDLKNRGLKDILIICTDNLAGISNAIKTSFPDTTIQKCIIHQLRNNMKHVSYKEKKSIASDLKKVYTATNETVALEELENFKKIWDSKYPHIYRSWIKNWTELTEYFKYGPELRKLIYTTNCIESFNSQMKKVTKNKLSFPTENSIKKLLYLAISNVLKKWTMPRKNWYTILNELQIYFPEKFEKYVNF